MTAPGRDMKSNRMVFTFLLIVIYLILMTLGLFNLYSASGGSQIFYSQAQHTGIGVFVFLFCGFVVSPKFLNTYSYWILGFICLLLFSVLILGKMGGGSQRWIVLGPLRMQPSEFAKIAVAIVVANYFHMNRGHHTYGFRELWPLLAMVGLIAGLIFPQPDFGTAGFIVIIALSQIIFVRLDWRMVGYVVASGAAIAPIVWTFLLKDYQKSRVLSFLDPDLDLHGKGYNALQSLVAIGSGGFTGKGYLQGTQTQLQFLPMRHTDFVFSVFAEENGFWGCSLLFFLFAGIAFLALEIARQAKDTFSSLLAVGLAAFIFMEFTINVAMVLRMFPVVGLPLPFFSYGGSTLITVCAALGLLVSIDRENLGRSSSSEPLIR
jgi:rod shape determining protein RodA